MMSKNEALRLAEISQQISVLVDEFKRICKNSMGDDEYESFKYDVLGRLEPAISDEHEWASNSKSLQLVAMEFLDYAKEHQQKRYIELMLNPALSEDFYTEMEDLEDVEATLTDDQLSEILKSRAWAYRDASALFEAITRPSMMDEVHACVKMLDEHCKDWSLEFGKPEQNDWNKWIAEKQWSGY